jgi:SAM-dependent methyltransferase
MRVSLCGILDAEIHRCDRCGFRQIRPRLDEHELTCLYPDDYFDPGSSVGFSAYAREQQRNEREGFYLARRLRRIAPRGRLLDVGCALGFLLEATRRYSGWEVQGLDVSAFAGFFARRVYGLDVKVGTLEHAGFPDASFDFIVQKDLLEHVLHPREHLSETRRILRPGGYLLLVTPNGEANLRPLEQLAARAAAPDGEGLPVLDQGHLSFFRREHLLRLFSETGYDVVEFWSVGLARGLRALGYHPWKRPKAKRAPGGHPRSDRRAGQGEPTGYRADGEERMTALTERLGREIDRFHTPLRSSPGYFAFRRATRLFDTLPGRIELGLDFRCLLRRPGG